MSDVHPNIEYQHEHRLAVVMYGGVSLAIYTSCEEWPSNSRRH